MQGLSVLPRAWLALPAALAAFAFAPAAPAAAPDAGPGPALKLSTGTLDLSRSRGIDEARRAQLRERRALLEDADAAATVAALRRTVRELEARVARLPAAPAAATVAQPHPARPPVQPPPAQPTATPAPPPAAAPQPAPASARAPQLLDAAREFVHEHGLWMLLALLLGLALMARGRARLAPARAEAPDTEIANPRTRALPKAGGTRPAKPAAPANAPLAAGTMAAAEEPPLEIAEPPRPSVSSDEALATRLPEASAELRRRYIEERFPEIEKRTIALRDPASVVKGARLFYEDGAVARAIELLRFAIEDNPGERKLWLALFEVFRLERLAAEFADLATRFRERHGDGGDWPKVQFFGREIDPANALYREEPVNTLETIGPREARRLAAAHVDPLAENWLDAPMDFQNEVLAAALRKALMAGAGLAEADLAPDPMPALRSIEMFTVA